MEKIKQQDENLSNILVIGIILILVLLICAGIQLFYVGYHNTDLGQNMRYVNAKFDLNLMETRMGGIFETENVDYFPEDLYSLGIQQMKISFIFSSIFWFLLGIILSIIFWGSENG